MKSKEKFTNIDKRKLTYGKTINNFSVNKGAHPLDLPFNFENKISQN